MKKFLVSIAVIFFVVSSVSAQAEYQINCGLLSSFGNVNATYEIPVNSSVAARTSGLGLFLQGKSISSSNFSLMTLFDCRFIDIENGDGIDFQILAGPGYQIVRRDNVSLVLSCGLGLDYLGYNVKTNSTSIKSDNIGLVVFGDFFSQIKMTKNFGITGQFTIEESILTGTSNPGNCKTETTSFSIIPRFGVSWYF